MAPSLNVSRPAYEDMCIYTCPHRQAEKHLDFNNSLILTIEGCKSFLVFSHTPSIRFLEIFKRKFLNLGLNMQATQWSY